MQLTSHIAAAASAFGVSLLIAGAAVAAPITPTFSTFGSLPQATFGGTGIPNDAVAITTTQGDLVLGLTAHQRFVGPNLANDGAGTFFAAPGVSQITPSPADPYANWNVAFYIGGSDVSDTSFVFEYDFDPAVGNEASTHGTISFAGVAVGSPFQDSYNMGMDFLATTNPALGLIAPGGAFMPNAVGEYTFRLSAIDAAGGPATSTAIRVTVGQVPEPASLALVGAALALMGAAVATRRKH